MKICILMGSPRMKGNTVTLLQPFMDELKQRGAEVEYITLYDKQITPCDACWTFQNVFDGYGCPKQDDMHNIFNVVLNSDCLVLATPIYSWYCTPRSVLSTIIFVIWTFFCSVIWYLLFCSPIFPIFVVH